jgi:hypothetical protein
MESRQGGQAIVSEPTRYYPAGNGVVRTDPKGPLINHYYYEELQVENARLKAEVARLEAFTTRTIIPNEILQAQVERLTKAGDAMYYYLLSNSKITANQWEVRNGWDYVRNNRLTE